MQIEPAEPPPDILHLPARRAPAPLAQPEHVPPVLLRAVERVLVHTPIPPAQLEGLGHPVALAQLQVVELVVADAVALRALGHLDRVVRADPGGLFVLLVGAVLLCGRGGRGKGARGEILTWRYYVAVGFAEGEGAHRDGGGGLEG